MTTWAKRIELKAGVLELKSLINIFCATMSTMSNKSSTGRSSDSALQNDFCT